MAARERGKMRADDERHKSVLDCLRRVAGQGMLCIAFGTRLAPSTRPEVSACVARTAKHFPHPIRHTADPSWPAGRLQ